MSSSSSVSNSEGDPEDAETLQCDSISPYSVDLKEEYFLESLQYLATEWFHKYVLNVTTRRVRSGKHQKRENRKDDEQDDDDTILASILILCQVSQSRVHGAQLVVRFLNILVDLTDQLIL